jgi:hypothetical protein
MRLTVRRISLIVFVAVYLQKAHGKHADDAAQHKAAEKG